jgi:hypothetical protein
MKRVVSAMLLVALSVAVAGCASSAKSHSSAYVPSFRGDVRITKSVPCFNGRQTLSTPGAVSHFHAVTAVMCVDGRRIYAGAQWEVELRKVAVSGVAASQRYFEQPDQPNWPGTGICTANLVGVVLPTFVDAHGRWLVPKAPVDGCGHPVGLPAGETKPPKPIRWRVVAVHKIRLMISAPAFAAGCDMDAGRPAPRQLRVGAPVFVRRPKTVRVCVYRTSPSHPWSGNFARGFRIDSSQTQRLLSAINHRASRVGCSRHPEFAWVIASPGTSATVELGGCYRVDGTDATADTAVVRSILGSS